MSGRSDAAATVPTKTRKPLAFCRRQAENRAPTEKSSFAGGVDAVGIPTIGRSAVAPGYCTSEPENGQTPFPKITPRSFPLTIKMRTLPKLRNAETAYRYFPYLASSGIFNSEGSVAYVR